MTFLLNGHTRAPDAFPGNGFFSGPGVGSTSTTAPHRAQAATAAGLWPVPGAAPVITDARNLPKLCPSRVAVSRASPFKRSTLVIMASTLIWQSRQSLLWAQIVH